MTDPAKWMDTPLTPPSPAQRQAALAAVRRQCTPDVADTIAAMLGIDDD